MSKRRGRRGRTAKSQPTSWRRRTVVILGAGAIVAATSIAFAVVGPPTAPKLDGAPRSGSGPVLPADCAPGPDPAALTKDSRLAVTTSTTPVKDLGIQPANMDRSEWLGLLALAKGAGASVVNTGVSWASLEPNGPHDHSALWGTLEQFVKDATHDGLAVRFQLEGFPSWARTPNDSSSLWLAPQTTAELRSWATWVRTMARTFGKEVRFFEVWNEENSSQFWPSGPDPTTYAALLACTFVATKSVAPQVTVVSGGLSTNDVGYLQHLYTALRSYPEARQLNDFFDMLGVHPYDDSRDPDVVGSKYVVEDAWGVDDTNFLGFVKLHAIMAAEGEGWKRIYIGEFGMPVSGISTAGDGEFPQVSPATRASWLTLAYRLVKSTGLVAAFSWYTFYPDAYNGAGWALVLPASSATDPPNDPAWRITPSYVALAAVANGQLRPAPR